LQTLVNIDYFQFHPMSSLNKYLIMAVLMTAINVPMYFYSKALLKASQPQAVGADGTDAHAPQDTHGDAQHAPAHGADHAAAPLETSRLQEEMAAQERPGRFQALGDLYKPPLLGKCKKLFERYNRKNFPDKPYKAFVYSFDGEAAYCADAYTDKSQEAAEEIVIRDCEEHHAGSGKYSPCRIYSSE
jgi:hypothetical protein